MFHISKFPSLTESTLELNKAISNGHHPCRFTFDHRIKETRKISHPLRFPLRISHTYEIRKKSARMEVYTAACPTRVFIHLAEERSFYRCLRERFAARQRAANRFVGQHACLSRCSQEKGRIPFGRVKREIWNSCGGTPSRDFPSAPRAPIEIEARRRSFPTPLPPSLVPLSPNISPNSLKTLLSDRVASAPVVF